MLFGIYIPEADTRRISHRVIRLWWALNSREELITACIWICFQNRYTFGIQNKNLKKQEYYVGAELSYRNTDRD
jgi:hypothetical protein